MKTLLIGDAPNTGKSNAITMCANYLLTREFKVFDCRNYNGKSIKIPKITTGNKDSTDFIAKLEGRDLNNRIVSVIITSASDTEGIIGQNSSFARDGKSGKNHCNAFRTK